MTDFTGEIDGFTYTASYETVSAGPLTWSAVVRNAQGEWYGSPSGMIRIGDANDHEKLDAAILAVETAITGGVDVDRGS